MRELMYSQALNEALAQTMKEDASVFVIGLGVDYPNGIFGSTAELISLFGKNRVFDVPLSEEALTGICLGSALNGKRPVLVHARADFMLVSMSQIVNHLAQWKYLYGKSTPVVIRSIIGRGRGQGAQHSQSPQSLFAHIPGLRVVMPSNAYQAKGCLISAIKGEDPVIFIEHRGLYGEKCFVPEEIYQLDLNKAVLAREGKDITIVSFSLMVKEALLAAEILSKKGVEAEVVDLCSLRPIDAEMICRSVKKTGRLIVADTGWKNCSISAEVAAIVSENIISSLKANIIRINLPEHQTPTSPVLENDYYPGSEEIVSGALKLVGLECEAPSKKTPSNNLFEGSF